MTLRTDVFRILAVLGSGPAPSGAILDRIDALSDGAAPPLATFYRRLKEAVDEGWIEVVEEEGVTPEEPGDGGGAGRPPRRFRLTAAGLRAARAEAVRLRGFADLLRPGGGPAA